MPQRKLQKFWQEMNIYHKINSIGSFFLFISLFFPWYSDLDRFATGDVYIGLNGPLYWPGFSLLLLSLASFTFSIFSSLNLKFRKSQGIKQWSNKSLQKLPASAGAMSFYLIFLINSIYFNPQFGLNITSKESGSGTLIALFGAAFMTAGGFLLVKNKNIWIEKEKTRTEIGEIEKLAHARIVNQVESLRKPGGLQKQVPTIQKENKKTPTHIMSAPLAPVMPKPTIPETVSKIPLNTKQSNSEPQATAPQSEKKYQSYRMDL